MGKTVLVIGASGDIGSAIATQLGNEGYQLILHYHQNREAVTAIEQGLAPETVLDVLKADLESTEGINTFLTSLVYPVDAIVFASGVAHYGLFQDTPEQVMDAMLSVHVKAPLKIVQNLLPSMIQQKAGKILFISSIWGEIGASYEVMYATVKGAQNSFVKSLAKEVGRSGISVNAISPGYIDTKMNVLDPEEKAQLVSEIPLNRPGTPEDIANAVSFLLQDKSSYIHGEIVRISGGWS
ncbi:elongation factor P 5-aminopentanone reductase [Ornithinibacillus contaminans]|uniref:elongation factor P 5-aminopentanone reductase n=1 Tax=Ornithinibacillus contaminans TaxID=694055 RepID=UPI00064DD275|nr:SDR family oxidoreductase [Ornithinibacillus contaminans]